jgi:hypothetical protein
VLGGNVGDHPTPTKTLTRLLHAVASAARHPRGAVVARFTPRLSEIAKKISSGDFIHGLPDPAEAWSPAEGW